MVNNKEVVTIIKVVFINKLIKFVEEEDFLLFIPSHIGETVNCIKCTFSEHKLIYNFIILIHVDFNKIMKLNTEVVKFFARDNLKNFVIYFNFELKQQPKIQYSIIK